MDDYRKSKFASTYFEGRAGTWYQFYKAGREWIPWDVFTQDVIHRFLSQDHKDPQAEFNKLKQTGTVEAYLEAFEELRAYVISIHPGLTDEYFMSSFISGLKEEIKGAVNMARPTTFEIFVTLAKQAEFNIQNRARNQYTPYKTNVSKSAYTNTQTIRSPQIQGPGQQLVKYISSQTANTPRSKTLTNAEIHERRRKGLCFHCDEPFSSGHICKVRLYTLQGEEEEAIIPNEETEEINEEVEEEGAGESCQISLQAITGTTAHNTIKIKGTVNKRTLSILIDSGATHNFIDPQTVTLVGCVEESNTPLSVTVADGNKLVSNSVCSKFKWEMQGHKFDANLRVLPLGGCDIVLGVEWLKNYSPVTFDFKKMEVTLCVGRKRVVLKGTAEEGTLNVISGKGLTRLIRKSKEGLMGYLFYMNGSQNCEEAPKVIEMILQQYSEVFREPEGLPPIRNHDHRIPLKEGSLPTSQRPYRTPFVQKTEIEKQVKEMMKAGIIQHSNSPFASPVLLVLKKDGSWRLCVDYRKLNDMTIKDKFPIPVIEELLDELGQAKWFTKLDLRSGYHQIRVAVEDIHKTAFRTHHGHFEFRVMPFGLTNAPASFQALMNDVFGDQLRKFVLVFFDDILVYSPTLEDHVQHFSEVLRIMKTHQLFA